MSEASAVRQLDGRRLAEAVLAGDRAALARAITLVRERGGAASGGGAGFVVGAAARMPAGPSASA